MMRLWPPLKTICNRNMEKTLTVEQLQQMQHVHCIGIGGIGLSALARLLKASGKTITGSDRAESKVTKGLMAEGVTVRIGHAAENIPSNTELVIYTNAIPEFDPDNAELKAARERGLPMLSYPQALGLVSAGKKTIALAGTHGKTTTTAMTAAALEAAGLDPTVVVGSLLAKSGTNYREGMSEWFVVEADESHHAFLSLSPTVVAITNIEPDHLDEYRDLDEIVETFGELVAKIPAGGALICNTNDLALERVMAKVPAGVTVLNYSEYIDPALELRVPGEHNRANAAIVLALAEWLKLESGKVKEALGEFPGTWRRFEYKGTTVNGVEIYDDYAHHPSEIKATLQAAREKWQGKIITVAFQPHLYSRTKKLFEEFKHAFDANVDQVYILPIYAAREQADPTISAEILAEAIQESRGQAVACASFAEAEAKLRAISGPDNIIFTMGAGDGYVIGEALLENQS